MTTITTGTDKVIVIHSQLIDPLLFKTIVKEVEQEKDGVYDSETETWTFPDHSRIALRVISLAMNAIP